MFAWLKCNCIQQDSLARHISELHEYRNRSVRRRIHDCHRGDESASIVKRNKKVIIIFARKRNDGFCVLKASGGKSKDSHAPDAIVGLKLRPTYGRGTGWVCGLEECRPSN